MSKRKERKRRGKSSAYSQNREAAKLHPNRDRKRQVERRERIKFHPPRNPNGSHTRESPDRIPPRKNQKKGMRKRNLSAKANTAGGQK